MVITIISEKKRHLVDFREYLQEQGFSPHCIDRGLYQGGGHCYTFKVDTAMRKDSFDTLLCELEKRVLTMTIEVETWREKLSLFERRYGLYRGALCARGGERSERQG